MESVAASAAIASSPSPPSFSPRSHRHRRRSLLPIASNNKKEDEANLHADAESTSIVPFLNKGAPLVHLSKDVAMGLALRAAMGRGWTTGSGMEGPPVPADSSDANLPVMTFPWSLYTKSPRRRMRVAFTCNVCGQRTTRAINPHAYMEGTVFVQCCGCNIFHKLVDNLNLFHEMKCYISPSFRYNGDMLFDYLDDDDDDEQASNGW